jgi:ABC-type xylose transport system permease subunit
VAEVRTRINLATKRKGETTMLLYLNEITIGGTSLIGTSAQQRGETRMWTRRSAG